MSSNTLLALGVAGTAATKGIKEGIKEGTEAYDKDVQRTQAREEAAQRKKLGELKLAQMGRQEETAAATHQSELELAKNTIQLQQQQTTQQGRAIFKQNTYNALDAYYEDYSPRHLNTLLQDAKQNPYAPAMFKDIARVDTMDLSTPQGKALLRQAQVPESELDALDGKADGVIDWEKVKKRYVVATQADGSQTVQDVLSFSATTGYGRYARKRQLEEMKLLADINKKGKGTAYKEPTSVTESGELATAREAIKGGTATPQQKAFVDIMDAKMEGTTGFRRKQSEEAISTFYEREYDTLSFEELRSNKPAMSLVRQVEDSYDLSEADRKDLKQAYQQVNAMRRAQGLDPESVGIMDSIQTKINRKITDEAGGREAKAAYSSLINVIRNQQFGSALTDKEIEAFNQAYGSNADQMTVVLSGLKEIGELTRSKLEAISNLNNDIVIKARTGHTREEIDGMLANIDRRIGFYNAVATGTPVAEAQQQFGTGETGQVTQVDTHLAPPPVAPAVPKTELKQKYGW